MSGLAVSIINYKTGDMTIAAAQSALDALGNREVMIVVVDNASGDGSAEQIEAWMAEAGDPRGAGSRRMTRRMRRLRQVRVGDRQVSRSVSLARLVPHCAASLLP